MICRGASTSFRQYAPELLSAGTVLVLGAWRLDRPALFGSEADSYYAARLPLGALLRLLTHVDAVHGVYYLCLHVWMSASSSLWWLRLPSVLATMVAGALVARLGKQLAGRRVAFLAGTLFALSPLVTQWAQNGRSYAIVTALVCATALALVTATRDPRPATWIRYGAALAAAGLVHEFALLASFAFAVTLVLTRVRRQVLFMWLVTTAAAWLVVTPLIVLSTSQSTAIDYLPRPGAAAVRQLVLDYFGPSIPLAIVTIALAGVTVVRGLLSRGDSDVRASALGLPLIIVPAAMLIVASFGRHSYYNVRYVVYGAVGAALLVACGVDTVVRAVAARTQRPIRLAAALATAAILAFAIAQWPAQQRIRTVASRLQDFTAPSVYLATHSRPNDAILFTQARFRAGELAYPRDYHALDDVALAVSPRASGTFTGVARKLTTIRARVVQHRRVWVVGECDLRQPLHSSTSPIGALHTRYRHRAQQKFLGTCVSLFENTSTSARPNSGGLTRGSGRP